MSKKTNKQKQSRFNFANHFDNEINKKITPIIVETVTNLEIEKVESESNNFESVHNNFSASQKSISVEDIEQPLIELLNEDLKVTNIDDKLIKEKLVLTGVYFTKSVKKNLQAKAKELEMSVSNMVEIIMLAYLKGGDVTTLLSSEVRQAGRPVAARKTKV